MAEIGSSTDIQNLVEHREATEADSFKTALMAILMENTDLDVDTIYDLVLNEGRNIIWC